MVARASSLRRRCASWRRCWKQARLCGGDEDQCWTLARIAEVVRRRFTVEYTLAGLDLLLHRAGWSVQVPARQAAERDGAAIAAWREEAWPVIKGRRRTWAPGFAPKTNQARHPRALIVKSGG